MYICSPTDAEALLSADGPMPIIPGFDFFVAHRKQSDAPLLQRTKGIVGSHGAGWREVRLGVQQELMRPKAAIPHLDQVFAFHTAFCPFW